MRSGSKTVALLALMLVLSLFVSPLVFALVDPTAPLDGQSLPNSTISFGYYVSVTNLSTCAINVPPYVFADPDAQNNALNAIDVQNIPDGTYTWNVTCTGDQTETGPQRSFTIDTVAPTLALIAPANGSVIPTLAIDIIPADDRAPTLTCDVRWNNITLDTLPISSNVRTARSYAVGAGVGTLRITCADAAGNTAAQERTLTVQPPLTLGIATDKQSYGPLEPVRLTISSQQGANVTVDICPNQTGFVQCSTALLGSTSYPQTITLPYLNRTGSYLVEAVARLGSQTRVNQTSYVIVNTLVVSIAKNATPKINTPLLLTASASGSLGPYRFAWTLHNGTVIQNAASVAVNFTSANTYTERVIAYDLANNSREAEITVDIRSLATVTIRVYDNQTGQAIAGANVALDDIEGTTLSDGTVILSVPADTYDLLASATGYRFASARYAINASRDIAIGLARDLAGPTVSIGTPSAGAVMTNPVAINAGITANTAATCTLYLGAGDGWFLENGTQSLAGSGTASFVRLLASGQHAAKVTCTDTSGRSGTSPEVLFTVVDEASAQAIAPAPVASTDEAMRLQEDLDRLTAAVDALDRYGQDEREAIALTGFDRDLRNARRAIQQAVRDLDALQFRSDLDAAGKTAERDRIVAKARELVEKTPQSLRITQKDRWVRYADQEQILEAAQALANAEGMPSDAQQLARVLQEDQQLFTISTTMLAVEYTYPDGHTAPFTVVHRAFTYGAGVTGAHRIVEVIPKEVARSAGDIEVLGESETLVDDPVIAFAKPESITYLLRKQADRSSIERITTLLVRPGMDEQPDGLLTGFAILGGIGIPTGWSWLAWLLLALALVYLAWYFDLPKQAMYLRYRFGRNEQVQYLRVLIRDADDQIGAGEYAKAEMLYKEIRMTYETLPVPARNDLYEEVMGLVQRMDAYYFNMVMIELDACLKGNDHEGAIAAYEKLIGTFERLEPPQQELLVQTVAAMGKRLGLEAVA